MWENMIFIFIDSVLLAALIFGGLATGAGVTSVVVAFILKHKTVIVVIIGNCETRGARS